MQRDKGPTLKDRILEVLKEGPVTAGELMRIFPDTNATKIRRAAKELIYENKAEVRDGLLVSTSEED